MKKNLMLEFSSYGLMVKTVARFLSANMGSSPIKNMLGELDNDQLKKEFQEKGIDILPRMWYNKIVKRGCTLAVTTDTKSTMENG